MTPIFFDFESYWSTDFSLSKISFMEYIQRPEAEVQSISIAIGDGPVKVYFGEHVAEALAQIDWDDAMAVAHNGNEFDFPMLVWKFGHKPKMFVDTLAMSRPLHQMMAGGSLKVLSAHYNLGVKDNTVLVNTKGKYLKDFTDDEIRAMYTYNGGDTEKARGLFKIFLPITPITELKLMDMTARSIVYPQFVCDTALLEKTLAEAEELKEKQLLELAPVIGALDAEEVRAAMASAPKFAAILESLGVSPPRKISKTTGKETYAFSKTDEAFTALLEHDDPQVQLAAATRLGVKSTLLESRLAKMKTCAEMLGGWMPVPLAYHAATTGRWGGRVWNPQNLPRIPRDKQGNIIPRLSNALRMSLCAPDGYRVVVSDLSGIELRVNHYLWGVQSTQDLYDSDPEADLYKEFAAALFGIPKEQVTKDQRQLAKVAQLGLGFGAGATTFKKVAKLMGGIELDDDEALRVTTAWRAKYIDIVKGWKQCQRAVEAMYIGASMNPDPRGLVMTGKEHVVLPSGRKLYYPNLHTTTDDNGRVQYKYGDGRNISKVYSGLMDENLVQAIARDVIAEQALTIKKTTGYTPALMVHDELVYIVPEHEAQRHLDEVNGVMRTAPAWLPGIVLWSEGDIAVNYGEAK